jgi:DNA invertase Pin-like site-specific DNA recombinase
MKGNAIIYLHNEPEKHIMAVSQRDSCTAKCTELSFRIKKVIEILKSRKTFFQNLARTVVSEAKEGDVIVIYSFLRFSDKNPHLGVLLDDVKKVGCRLLSVMESVDTLEDTTQDKVSKKIKESAWKLQAIKIREGFVEKRSRKEHFGKIPFGYMYSEGPGSPIIHNPEEMKLVERMKHLKYTENYSYLSIARLLNNERIPSPKSKIVGAWSINTVRSIIEREESTVLVNAKDSWYVRKEREEAMKLKIENDKKSKLMEEWKGMSENMLRTILKMSKTNTSDVENLSRDEMIQLLEKL